MAQKVLAVIPARLGSMRFARKVIYPFQGKPLLFYVYKELQRIKEINRLVIATDSQEIKKVAEKFDAEVVMTSKRHRTGSDRVAEVVKRIGGDIVINIQADNFGLRASSLNNVVKKMVQDKSIDFASMAYRIYDSQELLNPHKVKVVIGKNGNALWFSRLPLPFIQKKSSRLKEEFPYWGHIGVYLFRRKALEQFAHWQRTPYEKAESLEQLRILENGAKIKIFKTKTHPVSVDQKQDLKKLKILYT